MEHYNKITKTKIITHRELIKVTCDRCDAKIPPEDPYDLRELDLSFAEGSSYPDSGSKEGWKVEDLCNSCIGWLKELLIENNVKITKIDVDW